MQIEIKTREDRTSADSDALHDLNLAVYPPDAPPDGSEKIQWSSSMWSIFIWDDDHLKMMSHIGIVTRHVTCDDVPVFIGGIGGVQTHPNARGKGYAGQGMQRAGQFLRDEQHVDFSLLVCRKSLYHFYGQFGWQPFSGDVLIDQTAGKVKFTFDNPMLLAGNKPIPQCQIIDLCGKPW